MQDEDEHIDADSGSAVTPTNKARRVTVITITRAMGLGPVEIRNAIVSLSRDGAVPVRTL